MADLWQLTLRLFLAVDELKLPGECSQYGYASVEISGSVSENLAPNTKMLVQAEAEPTDALIAYYAYATVSFLYVYQ